MKKIKHIPNTIYDDYGPWRLMSHNPGEEFPLIYAIDGEEKFSESVSPYGVEKNWSRGRRPKPKSEIMVQGKYECAAAALAMLLGESMFNVKRAMGKAGWCNSDKGARDQISVEAARFLGVDLIRLEQREINETIGPCIVHVASLNMAGMGHAIAWNGKEMLDPNWGRTGRKVWGCEWAPWTIKPWSALVALDFNLSQSERDLHDKLMRKRKEDKLKIIIPPSFKEVVGMR